MNSSFRIKNSHHVPAQSHHKPNLVSDLEHRINILEAKVDGNIKFMNISSPDHKNISKDEFDNISFLYDELKRNIQILEDEINDKYSRFEENSFIGEVKLYFGDSDPSPDWMIMDGRELDISLYPELYEKLYKKKNNKGKFQLPRLMIEKEESDISEDGEEKEELSHVYIIKVK